MCEIVLRECIRCTCGSSFCEHILVYCQYRVKRKSVENTIKVFTKGGTKAPTAFAIKTFKERTDQYVELANEYLQMIDVQDTYAKEQFLKEHNAFLNDTQNKMDNAKKNDFLANVPNNMKPSTYQLLIIAD